MSFDISPEVDPILKATAERKILELEGLRQRLSMTLKAEESRNQAMWNTYGSELAGNLSAGERVLGVRITSATRSIDLLRSFVGGDMNISARHKESLRLQCEYYDTAILAVSELKQEATNELSRITTVETLLASVKDAQELT